MRLFISHRKGYVKDIGRSTLSGWIKKAILLAYQRASIAARQVHRVKAHNVRGLATSWVFLNKCLWTGS